MYAVKYGNPVYEYKGRSPKELEKEYPVVGDWVYHKEEDGTLTKWMFLGLWE